MIRMFNMDCMEVMAKMPDKAYELAIVDPPYGINVSKYSEIGYKRMNKFTPKNWDNLTPNNKYFSELQRVSVNQIIFGGNYFNLTPSRCFVIWDKGEGFKNRTYAEAEMAWTSFEKNTKIFKHDPLANGDYHNKIHICQKPVALYKWLLQNYAKPGDKILDTHGGSMSIAIACHDLGFDLDVYELDKDYFDAAVKRYEKHKQQPDMFVKQPEVIQEEMFK